MKKLLCKIIIGNVKKVVKLGNKDLDVSADNS